MFNLYCWSFNFNDKIILICKNKKQLDIYIYIYYRISYFRVRYRTLLLQSFCRVTPQPIKRLHALFCDLCYVVLEIKVYKTPLHIYFDSSWSSGSPTLNSSIFESK